LCSDFYVLTLKTKMSKDINNSCCRQRILGIDFFTNEINTIVDRAIQGGLVVVPAAPGLAKDFMQSPEYREALLEADLAIADSGFMVILWWLRTGRRLPKSSGLTFLREFIKREDFRTIGIFWIMPSEEETRRTKRWLEIQGVRAEEKNFYIAPYYGKGSVEDEELIARIEKGQPKIVMVGLGGGVQERLGLVLRRRLTFRPGIFCVGAAIAFLTGGQVRIPVWADRLYLGWLFRIVYSPRIYCRRYLEAFRLAPIVFKYKSELPPMREEGRKRYGLFVKRLFDIVFSFLLLVTLFPVLFLFVAFGIKLTSRGPVIFRQKRTGLKGKEFYCLKFRSMKMNETADTEQAKQDDPRITPFGRFLRNTYIDELPQFINVLKGEMSVVGPRPHMVSHTESYARQIEEYMGRHEMKPGITGFAQVTGYRGEIHSLEDMEGRVKRDLWYIKHWSFGLDWKIILRTSKSIL
jgi:lipopolysaccharide/colanic/teichoic acid biosynthesis glycosyltransferase/UDP-N-acetyl-D-mannosaminuronic acid transferase (WecB/TagA/CpsF family)